MRADKSAHVLLSVVPCFPLTHLVAVQENHCFLLRPVKSSAGAGRGLLKDVCTMAIEKEKIFFFFRMDSIYLKKKKTRTHNPTGKMNVGMNISAKHRYVET